MVHHQVERRKKKGAGSELAPEPEQDAVEEDWEVGKATPQTMRI